MVQPTPTARGNEIRYGDFTTLCDALDYAATCDTGFNYFDGKANLKTALTYAELHQRARDLAKRLVLLAEKDSRIGLAAVSTPEFAVIFMACQYAGIVPAPVPLPVTLGGRTSYERQLQRMADTGDFHALLCPSSMEPIMSSALNDQSIPIMTFEQLDNLPQGENLRPFGADDLCYIQYSSGSSSSPKGIIGTQKSVSANCHGIAKYGLEVVESDRCTSWLPLYHDMGLIGFMLTPLMTQISVDYIDPQDFTRRPITWLQLISDHKSTLSYSPTFGYELCVRAVGEMTEISISQVGGLQVSAEIWYVQNLSLIFKIYLAQWGFQQAPLRRATDLRKRRSQPHSPPWDKGC